MSLLQGDVGAHVLRFLELKDLLSLAATCSCMHRLIMPHDQLARAEYHRSYGLDAAQCQGATWKQRLERRNRATTKLVASPSHNKQGRAPLAGPQHARLQQVVVAGESLVYLDAGRVFVQGGLVDLPLVQQVWPCGAHVMALSHGWLYQIEVCSRTAKPFYHWRDRGHPIETVTVIDGLFVALAASLGVVVFSTDFVSTPVATGHWVIRETRNVATSLAATRDSLIYTTTGGELYRIPALDQEFGPAEKCLEAQRVTCTPGSRFFAAHTKTGVLIVNETSEGLVTKVVRELQGQVVDCVWNDETGAALLHNGDVLKWEAKEDPLFWYDAGERTAKLERLQLNGVQLCASEGMIALVCQ